MTRTLLPACKLIAIGLGASLIAIEIWQNAEYVIKVDGFGSMVAVVIAATICSAAALPFAERAYKEGAKFKAYALMVAFTFMVLFSFCASLDRIGSRRDDLVTGNKGENIQVTLANEAYARAKEVVAGECVKRGPRCRKAEEAVETARKALGEKPVVKVEDSMSVRLAAFFPFLTVAQVQTYQPFLFPIASQALGFLFISFGFSGGTNKPTQKQMLEDWRKDERKPKRKPRAKKAAAPALDSNVTQFRATH